MIILTPGKLYRFKKDYRQDRCCMIGDIVMYIESSLGGTAHSLLDKKGKIVFASCLVNQEDFYLEEIKTKS